MTEERQTEPGPLLRGYQKAKTKIAGLFGAAGDGGDDTVTSGNDWKGKPTEEVSEADQVRSQEEMKETFDGDGVMPSDKRHKGQKEESQKEDGGADASGVRTALPDGSATAVMAGEGAPSKDRAPEAPRRAEEADLSGDVDDGGPRGDVEAQAPDVHAERSVGTDDNPAAPDMGTLDQAALATLAEDEAGRVPSDGLGLDDGPGDVTYPGDVRS